tara:strand:- start:1228 stop:2484 length:1257 start_codon:yes stop_codon:yes gene_type:complete
MSNALAKELRVMWAELAADTDINCTISKKIVSENRFDMGDQEGERSDDTAYIPKPYRFNTQDGYESSDSDFQDLIDRMIVVTRNGVKRILFKTDAFQNRDGRITEQGKKALMRDIRNAIDLTCYQTALLHSSQVNVSTGKFTFQDAIEMENRMFNAGLGGYQKNALLSNVDYKEVANILGANQYDAARTTNALERAMIPDLATFSTMRSDYTLKLPGVATPAGFAVDGNQTYIVSTYNTPGDKNSGFKNPNQQVLKVKATSTVDVSGMVGSKISRDGGFATDPETRNATDDLLTHTIVAVDNVNKTLTVEPPIVSGVSPYKNCSTNATDDDALTILNKVTSSPSLFWIPEAITIVPGNIMTPDEGMSVAQATTEQGLPMELISEGDFHKGGRKFKGVIYFDVVATNPEYMFAHLSNQT